MLRLRKQLNFTQHEMLQKKSLYVVKNVTRDLVAEDIRYLQILIFKCEANWAYAMMLKQRSTTKSAKINANRARIHSIKRFKASAKESKALFSDSLDSMSQLEVEAYQLQMEGYLLLEYF